MDALRATKTSFVSIMKCEITIENCVSERYFIIKSQYVGKDLEIHAIPRMPRHNCEQRPFDNNYL